MDLQVNRQKDRPVVASRAGPDPAEGYRCERHVGCRTINWLTCREFPFVSNDSSSTSFISSLTRVGLLTSFVLFVTGRHYAVD